MTLQHCTVCKIILAARGPKMGEMVTTYVLGALVNLSRASFFFIQALLLSDIDNKAGKRGKGKTSWS